MAELAKGNLQRSQNKQKQWYDRTARQRSFQPGEEVLVLLPTTKNKLLAQWQGPYRVLRRSGAVIDMHDRHKRKRTFHVNMLRKWYTPLATNCWVEEVNDGEMGKMSSKYGVPVGQPQSNQR